MTIVPEKPVALSARSSADLNEVFAFWDDAAETEPSDLSGWVFRFAIKADALAATGLTVQGALASGTGITVTDNTVRVQIEKAQLLALIPAGQLRFDAQWELQCTAPGGDDGVYAAGPLAIVRGL